jgi:4-phosphopantoate---beta-alanine ligase
LQEIPKNHPRYHSLILRKRISEAHKAGVLAESGMIAHGRGEAFDYLLGEHTIPPAKYAIEIAAAQMLLAENPVISVNGNTAALSAREVVELSYKSGAKVEINLFYRTPERVDKIESILLENCAQNVLGTNNEDHLHLNGLEGPRSIVSAEGIHSADVVLVPLEDGDRAEALIANEKIVITIDLNPLSRTARCSTITIVDNLVRALPLLIQEVEKLKGEEKYKLEEMVRNFNNQNNLKDCLKSILGNYNGDMKPCRS